MRYGLCVANIGTYADPRNVVALAEEAEAAGWEALLVWDHLGFVWGPPAADPWVTLAAVAARTERARCSARTSRLLPRRRPHVLAHQVATLDVLSGGRVVFGAGIGGIESEFTAFGEHADARLRAEMLDEGLEVLRGLWSGERVDPPRAPLHGRRRRAEAAAGAGADADLDRREQPRPRSAGPPVSTAGRPTRRTRRA